MLLLSVEAEPVFPPPPRRFANPDMSAEDADEGALPPPQKKRYSREHLAKLLVICLLKTSLPILTIHQLMAGEDIKRFYLCFCELFSDVNREIAEAYRDSAGEAATVVQCKAALRAQAEQALASHLCSVPDKDG